VYDYVIYLGRFQPFHDGHFQTVQQALEQGKKLIIGIGSSNRSRSTDNPFTFQERVEMIHKSIPVHQSDRVHFVAINDYPYNDTAWITHVTNSINSFIRDTTEQEPSEFSIALMGYKKDESSKYLDWFPKWDQLGADKSHGVMSATDVRALFFDRKTVISEFVPDAVREALKRFAITPEYKWLLNEFEYIREYPKLWGKGPFITVDAVVEQMGYILLVTRKEAPFKGKLAIPGGFVNLDEWIKNARIRELREETKLADQFGKMPPEKMHTFLQKEKVYDDPKRSARGRVVTFAGLYRLPPAKQLYRVVGADDAEKADWYNMSDLDASMFMEDHYFIIQDLLGVTEGL